MNASPGYVSSITTVKWHAWQQTFHPDGSPGEIVGVGRLIKLPFTNEAEVAAIVTDAFQRKGVGRHLTSGLVQFALRDAKRSIFCVLSCCLSKRRHKNGSWKLRASHSAKANHSGIREAEMGL